MDLLNLTPDNLLREVTMPHCMIQATSLQLQVLNFSKTLPFIHHAKQYRNMLNIKMIHNSFTLQKYVTDLL